LDFGVNIHIFEPHTPNLEVGTQYKNVVKYLKQHKILKIRFFNLNECSILRIVLNNIGLPCILSCRSIGIASKYLEKKTLAKSM